MLMYDSIWKLQPGLSGNPFLRLEKRGQKDWERKTDKAAINVLIINQFRPKSQNN